MFLAVWTLYVADRLLDARHLFHNPLHTGELEHRHHFHHRYRTLFLAAVLVASIALAFLLPRIPPEAIRLYLILGGLLIGYFVLIHATSHASHRLPKELAVGLFFSAAIFIPTVARRPDLRLPLLLPALLFAALCSLNCLFIYAWEHDTNTNPFALDLAHPATRLALRYLKPLAALLAAACTALTLFSTSAPRALPAACALAALALLLIDELRRHVSPLTLRAAADLALLTPILFLLR